VTLWDVIEHLADPMREIQRAYRALKPGGLVVIHTMDIDSLFARVIGPKWPWLMEMHIYYFSQRTMAAMLEKAGFLVLHSGPQGRFQTLATWGRGSRRYSARLAAHRLGLERHTPGPDDSAINLGDLFTVYARKV